MEDVLKTKRTDIMLVDPRNIVVRDGFNVRKDLGDIEALAQSIIETGLQVPLKAKKNYGQETYDLVDGHRRMAAIKLAIELGADIPYVEVIPFKGNEEDQVFAMIITGTGQKPLNDIEQAEAIKRLTNFSYQPDEIAKKIGKSIASVYNLISLAGVPKKIKNLVSDGFISGGTVVQIIRQIKDESEQVRVVEQAIADAQKGVVDGDKPKKATAKNVTGLTQKAPFQKLKELSELLAEKGVENEKTELLNKLLSKIKESSVESLVKYFK
jgi:ParB family chromosome partitioning protein